MADPLAPVGPLLDAIADPLIVLEGRSISAVNRAAAALLDLMLEGDGSGTTLPPDIERLLSGAETPSSVMLADFGGVRRHFEMRVSRLDADHRLVHLIDRTAIEAAERMRVDFVANASHELRTPIAAIAGFAETLAEDEAGGDAATRARFLAIIAREAQRMQRLIEDLMSLSRIEADRHVAPQGLVDLAAVVREAATNAAEQRMPRGADLVIEPFDRPLMVRGDAAQLAQLAHNLVSNGFKYGDPGTPVRVTLSDREGLARLSVADRGEGIPAEHLPRITQRFYRVNAVRSRAVGGTGLGLAIVKHIAERHGATLDLASEVGFGTTITVRLPLASADPRTKPA